MPEFLNQISAIFDKILLFLARLPVPYLIVTVIAGCMVIVVLIFCFNQFVMKVKRYIRRKRR